MSERLTEQLTAAMAAGIHEFPLIYIVEYCNEERNWNASFFAIHSDPEDTEWAGSVIVDAFNEIPYEMCKWGYTCGMHQDEEHPEILLSNESECLADGSFTHFWNVLILCPFEEEFWQRLTLAYANAWGDDFDYQLKQVCEWAREFPQAAQYLFERLPDTDAMKTPDVTKAVSKFKRAIRQGRLE